MVCLCAAYTESCFKLMQMMRAEMVKFNPRFGIAKLKGTAYVGPDLVCEADMTLVLGK